MAFFEINITTSTIIRIIFILILIVVHITLFFNQEKSIDLRSNNITQEYKSSGLYSNFLKKRTEVSKLVVGLSTVYSAYLIHNSENRDLAQSAIVNQEITDKGDEQEKNILELVDRASNDKVEIIARDSRILERLILIKKYANSLSPKPNSSITDEAMKTLVVNNQTFEEANTYESDLVYRIKEVNKTIDEVLKELKFDALPEDVETTDKVNKNFIGSDFWDYFEGLSSIKKLAISLLFFNSALFSAATSILFIFYGDYLLTKYNIETKFPNLAKIIQLRRRFQRYYLILNIFTIITVVIVENIFSLLIITT